MNAVLEDQYTVLIKYRRKHITMKKMSDLIFEKTKTRVFRVILFFTKSCILCDNVENNVEPDRTNYALRGE